MGECEHVTFFFYSAMNFLKDDEIWFYMIALVNLQVGVAFYMLKYSCVYRFIPEGWWEAL